MSILLAALAAGFAASLGAHYTGACMGMPHSLGAVSARRALLIMAPLALLGAVLASAGVEHTVATSITRARLNTTGEVIVVAVAFGLTALYNRLRVPTSTIQILVLTLAGVALGSRADVRWGKVGLLVIVWIAAPVAAVAAGFVLARSLARVRALAGDGEGGDRGGAGVPDPQPLLGAALTIVGAAAAFTMGANDVANATGPLVGAGTLGTRSAAALGGVAIAVGVLLWGRPMLSRVAFDIVEVDRPIAVAAQAVQAAVVLSAVSFGLFTSMNQALVGAMAGAGAARGRHTLKKGTLYGIGRGWLLGPPAGLAAGYLLARLLVAAGTRLLA